MLLSIQIVVLSLFLLVAFWMCGKSLLKGIDQALEQHQQKQQQLQKMGVIRVNGQEVGTPLQDLSSGDPLLLAARKKVRMVVVFAIVVLMQVIAMLLFAIVSPYGTEAPLVVCISPMTLVPPIWNIVNVAIHRGRTKVSRGLLFSSTGESVGRSRVASPAVFYVSEFVRSRQHQIVPIETSVS